MADPASSGLLITTVGVEFWGFTFPQTTHLGLCYLIQSAYLILPVEYHCGPTCCEANHNPTDTLMVLRRTFFKLSKDRSCELMFVHMIIIIYHQVVKLCKRKHIAFPSSKGLWLSTKWTCDWCLNWPKTDHNGVEKETKGPCTFMPWRGSYLIPETFP